MAAEVMTMERLQRPVEWKVTTLSKEEWLVMAPSFAQAVALVQELAGEKVAFCQRTGDW